MSVSWFVTIEGVKGGQSYSKYFLTLKNWNNAFEECPLTPPKRQLIFKWRRNGIFKKDYALTTALPDRKVSVYLICNFKIKWDVQHWGFWSLFLNSPHCLVKNPKQKKIKKIQKNKNH
jgi:hypothetical protein